MSTQLTSDLGELDLIKSDPSTSEYLLYCYSQLIEQVDSLDVYIEIGTAALNEASANPESSWGLRVVGNTQWCSALESLVNFSRMMRSVKIDPGKISFT